MVLADSVDKSVSKFSTCIAQINLPNASLRLAPTFGELKKMLVSGKINLVYYNLNLEGGQGIVGLQKMITAFPKISFNSLHKQFSKNKSHV